MINYIYVLKKDGIPFYVGVTTDLKMRLSEHKVSFGKDIQIEKIGEHLGSTATAHSLEQFWIRKYLEMGIVLKNKPPKSTIETNCLYCNAITIQSSGKREKRFCSTSCRVMWNRKNGKKGEKGLTELQQMKVMYNSLMEKIDKISLPQMSLSEMMAPLTEKKAAFKGILPHENGTPQAISNTTNQKLDIKRTPAHWVELRRECETADDYAKWLEDLDNDIYLTSREKAQIKQTV